MNNHRLKYIAIFVSFLIIFIPIQSASVFAGINSMNGQGQDQIPNFLRSPDDVIVQVEASNNGQEIRPQDIFIDGSPFDICSDNGNGNFLCSHSNTWNIANKKQQLKLIELYNQNGNLLDQDNLDFFFDRKKPVVSKLLVNVDNDLDTVKIDYSVIDSTNSQNACVGLKNLEVLLDGNFQIDFKTFEGFKCNTVSNIIPLSTGDFSDGTHTVTIKATDRFENKVETISNQFLIDNTPPFIDETSMTVTKDGAILDYIDKKEIPGVKFKIDITEQDIKEVYADFSTLTKNQAGTNQLPATCNEIENVLSCEWTITLKIDTKVTPNILITASDNSGNSFTSSISPPFTYDLEAPMIESVFMTIDGESPLFVSDKEVEIFVFANISAKDLNPVSIRADLSPFGQSNNRGPNNIKQDLINNRVTATWGPFKKTFTESTQLPITVTAEDNFGNIGTKTFDGIVALDDEGPIVSAITTNYAKEDSFFVGTNTIITASIIDEGIGFKKEDVFLSIGLATPTQCTQDTCVWENLTSDIPDGQTGSLRVDSSTKDLLGNTLKSSVTLPVISDTSPPSITKFEHDGEFLTAGDTVTFTLEAEDSISGITKAEIDVSSISFEGFPKEGTCTPTENSVSCTFTISSLSPTFAEGPATVFVYDSTGNVAEKSIDIKVFELDITSTPDFFTNTVEVLPERIDRRLASKISMSVFLHTFLESNSNANIISRSVSCSELTSPNLVNEFSLDPFIVGKLPTSFADLDSDSKDVTCQLSLKVQQGTKVYEIQEVEEVKATLAFYNLPLGTIGDTVQEEIDRIDAYILDLEEKIEQREKITNLLGKICTIAETIGKIDAVLQVVLQLIAGLGCAFKVFGGDGMWAGACLSINGFHKYVAQWVWDPGVKPNFKSPGFYFKAVCSWYGCKLYDPAFIVQSGISVGTSALRSIIDDDTDVRSRAEAAAEYEDARIEAESLISNSNDFNSILQAKVNLFDIGGALVESSSNHPEIRDSIIRLSQAESNFRSRSEAAGLNVRIGEGRSGHIEGDPNRDRDREFIDAEFPSIIDYAQSFNRPSQYDSIPKSSQLASLATPDAWNYDPYRSIHYAHNWKCWPGIVYNWKKDRQINCIYRDCITEHAELGIETASCAKTLKQQQCLYVDSAQYKIHGEMNKFWDRVRQVYWGDEQAQFNTILFAANTFCSIFKKDPVQQCIQNEACTGALTTICGITATIESLSNIYSYINDGFDFTDYDLTLQGTDYCAE